MLVLSRKPEEQIRIGDSITVSILKVKGNVVRVGIEAPRDIRVVRGELPPKGQVLEVSLDVETATPPTSDAPVVACRGREGMAAGLPAASRPLSRCNPRRPRPLGSRLARRMVVPTTAVGSTG